MTYQNKIISDYILSTLEKHEINIGQDIDIDNLITNKIKKLTYGQDIALDVEDEELIGIHKLDNFEDTSIINKDSIIISYRELEAIYYETTSF
jgi:hypothetical protein